MPIDYPAASTVNSALVNSCGSKDMNGDYINYTDNSENKLNDSSNSDSCGYLPNNNECDNLVSSVCNSEEECSGTTGEAEISTPRDVRGESSSSDLQNIQESDAHSVNTTDDDKSMNDSADSVSQQDIHETRLPEDLNCSDDKNDTCDFVMDHSNGAIVDSEYHHVSKSKKKSSSGPGRGRPKKAQVTLYHSQISGDKNTIKIRIKKNVTPQIEIAPTKKKSGRRKKHRARANTEDYDSPPKRSRVNNYNDDEDNVSSTQVDIQGQASWGTEIPERVLYKIFQNVCNQEGCLPALIRFCKVCRLWRKVALTPTLWHKIDLNYVKERSRTDLTLHWLIHNRLTMCQDLNLGEWKVRDIAVALEAISKYCVELRGLNLSGWNGLSADNLNYITTECDKLERLDLSSINSTSAINAQPLVALGQTMNARLTHLVLAHNKIAGFTQIITSIATHCPNLQLLDISNIKTYAHTTALLHIEKLQVGCPKLRVLRITNSQIRVASVALTEQVASPGFPMLEELSLAGLEEDKTTTSRSVDDDGIDRILKSSTKLRLLDVRGCTRITDSGLVRVPAWDLEHLFLSACSITRAQNSGLELIVQKWSHSLLEVDLAWTTAAEPLDAAVMALAEKGAESKLRVLNLCGSSVSLEPVKAVLMKCPTLHSINLQSCRALPRGIKRLYTGLAVAELRQSLQDKPKTEASESENEHSPAYTQTSVAPME